MEAIRHKHASQGSESYATAARACTDAISAAYRKYVIKKKDEMKSLKRGSKQWWAIAKTLMDGATKTAGVPSLKTSDGQWIHEAKEKADAFADMLSSKFVLPADLHPKVTDHRNTPSLMCGFILIRERWVRRELKALRLDQATGPNAISARLLFECAHVLCRPLCRILRR